MVWLGCYPNLAIPSPVGLLRLVSNEDELAAVLAHECAHVVAR